MLRVVSSNITSFSQMFRQKDKKPTFCSVGSHFYPYLSFHSYHPFPKGMGLASDAVHGHW